MTITSPMPDLATTRFHRDQFPALENKTYFNFGGQGPMPRSALDAMFQAQQYIQQAGPFSSSINTWLQGKGAKMRQLMATQLGAAVDTITLTEDVTVGCNIPLWGMPWQAGDQILMSDCEHPGIIAAVQEVCRRFQVSLKICPLLGTLNGGDPTAVIAADLTPQTRMLVISHVLWNTGQILPLQQICRLCHDRPQPVLVLVDAAQSVGMLPLNLTDLEADFYAFTGHKWWCGPAGLGGLYVRPEALEQIHPTFIGWRGLIMDAEGNPTGWKPNGQRFEVATSDYPLYAGLSGAISHQNNWGDPVQRYQRICELSQLLWSKLNQLPQIQCLRQTPPDSGLVSFWVLDQGEPSPLQHKQLVDTLEQKGFFLRTLLSPNCVRACIHYLTLESEIEQLVAVIGNVLG